ncbi:tRNA selenocysteine 1-associated protein 1-like [Teleopsis dalmanni]|uniref:tRNA selenocysteine 1-associated protein 1-like n=1 Tax=Teleopsis dalmanni TaxID=139649 RepID=UPI0018CE5377|nr:tRNA selenocysteine 1-associated protein 1-like [Teleopsis dalmanni]
MAKPNFTEYQLWMGNLERYMDEDFIFKAFRKMNENPDSVRMIHEKNGDNAGYCFINFPTDKLALNAMNKLNGMMIPDTMPPVRFLLNFGTRNYQQNLYSAWIGGLSCEVDDYGLFKTFAQKYASVKSAKVILESSSRNNRYGFVSFSSKVDLLASIKEMNGYVGLGTKALKVRNATSNNKSEKLRNRSNSESKAATSCDITLNPNCSIYHDFNLQGASTFQDPISRIYLENMKWPHCLKDVIYCDFNQNQYSSIMVQHSPTNNQSANEESETGSSQSTDSNVKKYYNLDQYTNRIYFTG